VLDDLLLGLFAPGKVPPRAGVALPTVDLVVVLSEKPKKSSSATPSGAAISAHGGCWSTAVCCFC